jgi:hypothetical protein
LFWTQSAALKFLYPYYARFYSQENLAGLYAACTNSVPGKTIYAIGHRFPTIYEEYSDAVLLNDVITVWSIPGGTGEARTTTLGEMLIATE